MTAHLRPSYRETSSTFDQLMSDLAHADERQEEQAIRIRRNIALYERIYGRSSEQMMAALATGELEEDHDICEWLFQLELLNHVAAPR